MIIVSIFFILFISSSVLSEERRVGLILAPEDELKEGTLNAQVFKSVQETCTNQLLCTIVKKPFQPTSFDPMEINAALKDMDAEVIVGVSASSSIALEKAGKENSGKKYIIVDQESDATPNVQGIAFREEELGYLAGVIAGTVSTNMSKHVGVFGGVEIRPVKRYISGFWYGVKKTCSDCKVTCGLGRSFGNDKNEGSSFGSRLVAEGVDIVAHNGGATGSEMLKTVTSASKFAIGFGTDEFVTIYGGGTNIGSEFVLSSITKLPGNVTSVSIKEALFGNFQGGTVRVGVKENAISVASCHYGCRFMSSATTRAISEAFEKLSKEGLGVDLHHRTGDPVNGQSTCDKVLRSLQDTGSSASIIGISWLVTVAMVLILFF